MKIIKCNTHDSSIPEELIAENVHPQYAHTIADWLNTISKEHDFFYDLPDEYVLNKGGSE